MTPNWKPATNTVVGKLDALPEPKGVDPRALEVSTKPGKWPLDPAVWAKRSCNRCYGRGFVGLDPCTCAYNRLKRARTGKGPCDVCETPTPASNLCGHCGGRHCALHRERESHPSTLIVKVYGRGDWAPECAKRNRFGKPDEFAGLLQVGTRAAGVYLVDAAWHVAATYELVRGLDGAPRWEVRDTHCPPYQPIEWARARLPAGVRLLTELDPGGRYGFRTDGHAAVRSAP